MITNHYKAQISMEFLFFVSMALLILSIYSIYVVKTQVSYVEKVYESNVNYWTSKIKWYVDYAYMAGHGFHTFLELPSNINGKPYNISILKGGFILKIENSSYYKSLIAYNVTGSFYTGEINEIINNRGVIYVKRASN